ncbi:MAG: TetR family transcriptional regulator [Streptosporangiales bacterium]|nr:TetR family transcriptional regulator [Streptosporangiales bacterium]
MNGRRRAARRRETIDEILAIAVEVMTESGVAGLSLSEVARRLGIRPPSLYKYFPSRLALYDRLFRDGQQAYLDHFRAGAATADPGLPALAAALDSGSRWALAHQPLTQLLFWRPVPGFRPSAEAFAPAEALVEEVRAILRDAVARGQLRADAAGEDGAATLSILVTGVMSQQLANGPDETYDSGTFTRLMPHILTMFRQHFAPTRDHHADRASNDRNSRTTSPQPRGRGR